MTQTNNFPLKTDKDTLKVCRAALEHANVQLDAMNYTALSAIRQHGPYRGSRLYLNLDEGDVLQGSLRLYADDEARPGSTTHKIATDLGFALDDFVVTRFDTEVKPKLEAAAERLKKVATKSEASNKLVGGPIPTATLASEEAFNRKRDEIFRHIVGNPAKLNVWGQPVVEEEKVEESLEDRDILDGVWGYSGNEQMKKEGAAHLIHEKHRESFCMKLAETMWPGTSQKFLKNVAGDLLSLNDEDLRSKAKIHNFSMAYGLASDGGHDRKKGATMKVTTNGVSDADQRFMQKMASAKDTAAEIDLLASLWEKAPDISSCF